MAAIRAINTKPEMTVRRALHRGGLRFRLHAKKLPGCPDLVFPQYRAVIFVHGCFFHGHKCSTFRWPKQNAKFWRSKIAGNRLRDARAIRQLGHLGWRSGVVWECALRGPAKLQTHHVIQSITEWLRSDFPTASFTGITSRKGERG